MLSVGIWKHLKKRPIQLLPPFINTHFWTAQSPRNGGGPVHRYDVLFHSQCSPSIGSATLKAFVLSLPLSPPLPERVNGNTHCCAAPFKVLLCCGAAGQLGRRSPGRQGADWPRWFPPAGRKRRSLQPPNLLWGSAGTSRGVSSLLRDQASSRDFRFLRSVFGNATDCAHFFYYATRAKLLYIFNGFMK